MSDILDETGIMSFYTRAQAYDFSRDFQFRIINMAGRLVGNDFIYMTTATLPTRAINNQPTPFMGLSFNVPGSVSYPGSDAWTVTFRAPQKNYVRDILEGWQRGIFSERTSTGDYRIPNAAHTIDCVLIDFQGNPISTYKLIGCYAVNLGDISYNLTGGGTPVEFTTTLAYQYWEQGTPLETLPNFANLTAESAVSQANAPSNVV